MRLLITVASLAAKYGGPSLSALRTAEHTAALGATVGIAYGESPATPPIPGGGAALHLPIRIREGVFFPQYPAYRRALSQQTRDFAPDIVYDFGVWLPQNFASYRVARAARRPWICSPRGMLEPWPRQDKGLKKSIAWQLYQKRMLRAALALIATSEQERDNLQRLLPGAKLWVVPNGVDLPERTHAPAMPLRQALFLSRLHPKKQPDLLIRAWAKVKPAGWRLVLAGPGMADYRGMLERLIREQAADTDIILREAAFDDDKDALLASSELFVLPTFSENFGIVIAEALAHGLPVITTTGTPWRRIEQDQCGWWVAPTEEAIAATLRAACRMPRERLAAMGQNGRRVASEYSWAQTARALLDHCVAALASR